MDQLAKYQETVDTKETYVERIGFAKKDFSIKNTRKNRTFNMVKSALRTMSGPGERCHYCEDSKADEVEHLLPKDVYPEHCYNWNNYLYACGPCNGPKGNLCAIIDAETRELIPFRRLDGQPFAPPPIGIIAIIDQVAENPLDYFYLDIKDYFLFSELPEQGTPAYLKAQFTLKTLRLNERPSLIKQRQLAYDHFIHRLTLYVQEKDRLNPDAVKLSKMEIGIKEEHHQTVWQEMKRQHHQIPELTSLFVSAPEALGW